MLISDLFNKVLIEPAKEGANELNILAGYASASMADKHIASLININNEISINLIVGMTKIGINKIQHKAFQKLTNSNSLFSCNYLVEDNPCHAKVFIWLKNNQPDKAFVGSANYTITGFGDNQTECLVSVDPKLAKDFYDDVFKYCKPCNCLDIESDITIIEPRYDRIKEDKKDFVVLPLTDTRTGETHARAGLNWGQRNGRERNQAYIPIPSDKKYFFPPHGERFTVLTDDDESFIMVVAQDGSKALHSTESNSLIGLYFRNRMGLESGVFVNIEDLDNYGRKDVGFYRIDSDTYRMDFSSDKEKEDDEELKEK